MIREELINMIISIIITIIIILWICLCVYLWFDKKNDKYISGCLASGRSMTECKKLIDE